MLQQRDDALATLCRANLVLRLYGASEDHLEPIWLFNVGSQKA